MTNEQNQIEVLIQYKADFDKASKNLQEYLKSTEDKIASTESKLVELVSKKSKAAKSTLEIGKQELDLLYRQKNALLEQLKVQDKLGEQSGAMHKMLRTNIDNEIKERKNLFSDLKNDILNRNKLNTDYMLQWKQQTDARISGRKSEVSSMRDYYKEVFSSQKYDAISTKITEKEKRDEIRRTLKESADSKRAYSKTFGGALTEGTTFGHKVATTAQYAAAGTAIFGVASATTAVAAAALEADLNMRTMSAVLRLNTTEASALDSQVRKLGETYGGTTGEIEQVAIALGRAGVKTKDITDATKVVLAMARLTGDTFEQSASAVISYQQVFGDTKNITELGNKLAYIANVSRLSTQDIGTFSNYALAAAKDVGLTEDAVGGLAAAFSNAGVNASTIGTQIRRFTSLLTESSTDVDNFFKGIGVNQANLLYDLQKGGEDSNKALLDFVNTLSKVDKAKFTGLVGQMDILAGNSLKLMRNNSDNITKYVKDLQTGVGDQLENTRVILESYIVTYEALWNKIKNLGSDALQSDNMKFFTTSISTSMSLAVGDMEQAKKEALGFTKSIADANMKQAEIDFANGKLESDKYLAMKSEYISRVAKLEKQARDTVVKETKKSTADQMINIDNLIRESIYTMNNGAVSGAKLSGEAAKNQQALIDDLVKQKIDLYTATTKQKAADKDSITTNATLNLGLEKQLANIRAMKSAKLDTAAEEKMFNDAVSEQLKKNNTDINNQVTSLGKYADAQTRVQDIINSANGNVSDLNVKTLKRLNEIKNTTITPDNKDELTNEVSVLNKINSSNSENVKILTQKNELIGKNLTDTESSQRKAEAEAARRQKITDDRVTAETKIQELTKQILSDENDSISKAQSRLGTDAALLSLAYDRYDASRGTADEEERLKEYRQAESKYLETSVTVIAQVNKEQEKRASLQLELNSSLDQAIEGEQVRLGIIEKATDSEYEKLRVKIEQGKIDGLLKGEELARQETRLAQLGELQKKKKDTHTLAMEYQREIADQETAGYIAAKAGLASLESGMMNFFDVTSKGWLDWHALASDVLSSIYKQLLQELVIKQMVSGIASGISGMFSTPAAGSYGGVTSTAIAATPTPTYSAFPSVPYSNNANGGIIPTKGYANGGVLSGGTGIRDDIYLGNVSGTQVFAMGGEFITRKDSVNSDTKGTLDYINKTGSVPNGGSQVNVPVSIKIDNQTAQNISADMIQSMTQTNDKGDYEKVVSIVLKAATVDPRMRSLLKGR